nr:hypothetical protein [Tanacetum cinerariifolium]
MTTTSYKTRPNNQPSSSSISFYWRGRLPSRETPSADPQQQPEPEVHTITLWTNGFTINDDPLRRLGSPQNASFLDALERKKRDAVEGQIMAEHRSRKEVKRQYKASANGHRQDMARMVTVMVRVGW